MRIFLLLNGFNSNKVRLRALEGQGNPFDFGFNSNKVRLRVVTVTVTKLKLSCFNSNKVRLRALSSPQLSSLTMGFNSNKVRLRVTIRFRRLTNCPVSIPIRFD